MARDRAQLPAATALVFLGGGAGSIARYGIGRIHPTVFPWATLTINLTGAFLLGVLVVLVNRWRAHPLVRPLFGTGVLGGYTTFSTFALETRALAAPSGIAYVGLSVAGGLLAAFAGMQLAHALSGWRSDPAEIDPDVP